MPNVREYSTNGILPKIRSFSYENLRFNPQRWPIPCILSIRSRLTMELACCFPLSLSATSRFASAFRPSLETSAQKRSPGESMKAFFRRNRRTRIQSEGDVQGTRSTVLTLVMLRLLSSSLPSHVGTHCKALVEHHPMSTHVPEFQSFPRCLSPFHVDQVRQQQQQQ